MADDLGDSHPNSLQQGGGLPANSTALRTVGKIYPLSDTTITVNLFPEKPTNSVVLRLFNQSGVEHTNVAGPGTLTLTYTATAVEYHTLRVQNASSANAAQRVYVKATYTAPRYLRAAPVITQPTLTTNAQFRFNVTEQQGLNLPARFYRARYEP
jgi:alpha-amylase